MTPYIIKLKWLKISVDSNSFMFFSNIKINFIFIKSRSYLSNYVKQNKSWINIYIRGCTYTYELIFCNISTYYTVYLAVSVRLLVRIVDIYACATPTSLRRQHMSICKTCKSCKNVPCNSRVWRLRYTN